MSLYDRSTDRKPHAHSLWFGRKKCLEDTVLVLTSYSRTRVFHVDRNTRSFLNGIGTDPQYTRTIGDGAHRFDGVHNQIEENLLQWHTLARDLR